MKKRYILGGIFSLAAIGCGLFGLKVYGDYNKSIEEQKAIHAPASTEIERCIENEILTDYPDAFGGIIRAEDRVENYQQFGDYLHYRDRGVSDVTSVEVSVSRLQEGSEIPAVYIRNMQNPVAIIPPYRDSISWLRDVLPDSERTGLAYANFAGEDHILSLGNDDPELYERQADLVKRIRACVP